jgi:hypothetical protein
VSPLDLVSLCIHGENVNNKLQNGEIPSAERSHDSSARQARNESPSDKGKRSPGHLPFETVLEIGSIPSVRAASYEDCINYFVANEPPEFSRAAILREKVGFFPFTRYKITQIYLDVNDEVVRDEKGAACGRSFLADSLDDELRQFFGNRKILIVE